MRWRLKFFTQIFIIVALFFSCKKESLEHTIQLPKAKKTVNYAQGFNLEDYGAYKLLTVSDAFPNSNKTYTYALVPSKKLESQLPSKSNNTLVTLLADEAIDGIIQIPLTSVVVTSTTHIPSLEMLGVIETLKGFPNVDYISSTLSRKRINDGKIKELGQNESINTELTIDLQPDAVVGFGVDGENKAFASIQQAGIPVIYNGDWVEKDPLGKAEWIKFFGALYNKDEEATALFNKIENDYERAKEIVATVATKPTVLSGALYKDVWYVAHGDSWQAKIIADAGGDYLWAKEKGTGSIALSLEAVLEKGQQAAVWIAPGQFTRYSELVAHNPVYGQFDAFKNKNAFTFASKQGETGGILYYELAPNRPDLVLKDLIKALHPKLLPTYEPFFFTALEQ